MSYPAKTQGDQVTSWIPLTTAFRAPQSCSSLFHLEGGTLVAFDPAYGVQINTNAICQPAEVTSWWLQANIFQQTGLRGVHTAWSLLPLTCPQGFYTAASHEVSGSASTLVFCCPNGYPVINSASGTDFGNCVSTVTSGQVLTYVADLGSGSSVSGYATETTTFRSADYVGAIAVEGYALSVATTTALPHTPTDARRSIQPTASSGSTATNKMNQSATSSAETSHAQTDEGLSNGAEAGIGIGAALGFIGVVALIVAMFMMRQRRTKRGDPRNESSTISSEAKYASQSQSTANEALKYQKHGMPNEIRPSYGGREWSELSGERAIGEMDGRTRLAELEGHNVDWPRQR